MGLDLDGVGIEAQAERFDHLPREGRPVDLRAGRQMRVVVAHRAVHLGEDRHLGQALQRALEPCHHIGQFLAQRGGRGRLAVGAREHGRIGERVGHLAQPVDQPPPCRQQYLGARTPEHQRMRGVVDVLGGAGEVDELGRSLELRLPGHRFLQEVLHRLDIVVGDRLDRLDARRLLEAEPGHQLSEEPARGRIEGRQLGQAGIRQRDQPGHLHLDPEAHEGRFREQVAQRAEARGIASVERRQGGE